MRGRLPCGLVGMISGVVYPGVGGGEPQERFFIPFA